LTSYDGLLSYIQLESKLDSLSFAARARLVANKKQRTIYLSPSIWAQIDDLIRYYGDNQHEVLGRILSNWLSEHQREIAETKARIDGLALQIEVIRKQADDEAKRKGKP